MKRRFLHFAVLLAAVSAAGFFSAGQPVLAQEKKPLTVFVAKKIVTMDTTNPTAKVIAVRGKRIVAVGTMASIKPWLDAHPHTIDRTFADRVLMPGFIDPHLHPMLGAIQMQTYWITPETWRLHDGTVKGITTPEGFQKRLREVIASDKDTKKLLIIWGWSEPYHGPLTRADLDKLAPNRPVMILQRSTHEVVFNTNALNMLKLTEKIVTSHPQAKQVNWEKGHFIEGGMFDIALPRMASYLFSPAFIDPGFRRNRDYMLSRGVTTAGDMATGGSNWELELAALKRNFVDTKAPLRIVLIPDAYKLIAQYGGLQKSFDFVNKQLTSKLPHPLVGGKRIKMFADGAIFSWLMVLNRPGYVGFGQNEWITPKEEFRKLAKLYWEAGYRIHVHANGDGGIDFVLSEFEKLQLAKPRLRHALALEHYGYANERINRRVANFGALVSANPYYVTFLGDAYARFGLTLDRARRIAPIGGLVSRGVPVTLHSDFGMAPADPLALAWAAITRQTLSGKKMVPPGGLTMDQAMRAITINAAYHLGLEKDLGTIEAGKIADFAVLDKDPYDVGAEGLRDIKVWGIVFEGRKVQAKSK